MTPGARPRPALLAAALLCAASACSLIRPPAHDALVIAATHHNALAVSDALEALIAAGTDTPADREYAYAKVCASEEQTAGYMFARAAVTGRLVQQRGLLAAHLLADIERSARRSRELDPSFRDAAATRLLGTLYVMAPAAMLEHGDSEEGIELLEGLAATHPDVPENHLRLAEAYLTLGDPAPARPHLCRCLPQRAALRRDDQMLLDHLAADAAPLACAAVSSP